MRSAASLDEAAAAGARVSLLGWLRFAARLLGLLGLLLALLPLHYLTHAIGRKSHWPRVFLRDAVWIIGGNLRTAGRPLEANVFFIANHISWLDIAAMGGASGAAFISKAELRDTPVMGWLANLNRTLYVSREDKLGVAGQIAMLREAMAENHAIAVFPEGTTSNGRSLLPFKTSLLAVLEPPPPGVMVQPALIDYGAAADAIAWIGQESGKDNGIRILSRAGRFPLTVHFLEPFDPAALGGRKAVAAEAQRRVGAALERRLNGLPLE